MRFEPFSYGTREYASSGSSPFSYAMTSRWVARRAGVPLQVVAERLGADDVRETAEGGRAVQDLEEEALHVDGPAFVEPEVRRVCVAEERL
jgi:hypothetical protein